MSLAKLQRRLQSLGLYDGKLTREANAATRKAIALYREHDLHDEEVDRLLAKRAAQ